MSSAADYWGVTLTPSEIEEASFSFWWWTEVQIMEVSKRIKDEGGIMSVGLKRASEQIWERWLMIDRDGYDSALAF